MWMMTGPVYCFNALHKHCDIPLLRYSLYFHALHLGPQTHGQLVAIHKSIDLVAARCGADKLDMVGAILRFSGLYCSPWMTWVPSLQIFHKGTRLRLSFRHQIGARPDGKRIRRIRFTWKKWPSSLVHMARRLKLRGEHDACNWWATLLHDLNKR